MSRTTELRYHSHVTCTISPLLLLSCDSLVQSDGSSDQALRQQIGDDVRYLLRAAADRLLNPIPLYKLLGDKRFDAATARFDAFILSIITEHEQAVQAGGMF